MYNKHCNMAKHEQKFHFISNRILHTHNHKCDWPWQNNDYFTYQLQLPMQWANFVWLISSHLPPPPSPDTSQLAGVTMTSVSIFSSPASAPAPWVETCSCPRGFAGEFCERCAPGFTREDPSRGPFATCVPCNCHQHGTCHPETGEKLIFCLERTLNY